MGKPEALRLADALTRPTYPDWVMHIPALWHPPAQETREAAAELRRLSSVEAQRDVLLEALIKCRDRFFPADQPERDRDELWEPVNAAIKAVEGEKNHGQA